MPFSWREGGGEGEQPVRGPLGKASARRTPVWPGGSGLGGRRGALCGPPPPPAERAPLRLLFPSRGATQLPGEGTPI